MFIKRKDLRKLIEASIRPKNPIDYIDDETKEMLSNSFINHEDESFARQGYALATGLQEPIDMKRGSHEWEDQGYEGYDYLEDKKAYDERNAAEEVFRSAFYGISKIGEIKHRWADSLYLNDLFNDQATVLGKDIDDMYIITNGEGGDQFFPGTGVGQKEFKRYEILIMKHGNRTKVSDVMSLYTLDGLNFVYTRLFLGIKMITI